MFRQMYWRIPKTWILWILIFCLVLILQDLFNALPQDLLPGSSPLGQLPVEDLDAFDINGEEKNSTPDSSTPDEDTFTIIMYTFKYKRMNMVNSLLRHLNGFPNISQVVLIWSYPGGESVQHLPLPATDYPVRIFATSKDSLNVRFSPLQVIRTKAIFILDDDTFIDHQFILHAFRLWKQNPERIVGFKARGVKWNVANDRWEYERRPLPGNISIVLTGSAFIHQRFLWLYTYKMPGIIREWIDKKLNCEDIAMNFLISNITQKAPIPVLSETKIFNPWGRHEGLSSRASHFEERNECVNFFAKVYGRNPLISNF